MDKPIRTVISPVLDHVAIGVFDGNQVFRGEPLSLRAFVGRMNNRKLIGNPNQYDWSLSEAIAVYYALGQAIHISARLLQANELELPMLYSPTEFGQVNDVKIRKRKRDWRVRSVFKPMEHLHKKDPSQPLESEDFIKIHLPEEEEA